MQATATTAMLRIADDIDNQCVGNAPSADMDLSKRPTSGVESILRNLPTPGRNRPATKAVVPASAAEPWGLQDAAAPPQKSNYRELLQLRGQQAIQRSQLHRALPGPPPAMAAKFPPTPTMASAAPTPPPSPWSNSQVQGFWMGNTGEVYGAQFQNWCDQGVNGGNVTGMLQANAPLTLPVTSRQDASMRPLAPGAYLPGQQQSPTGTCSGSPSSAQEMMMTTLAGSGAFSLDEQQIAQALINAAPEVYDD